jgi:ferredoxin
MFFVYLVIGVFLIVAVLFIFIGERGNILLPSTRRLIKEGGWSRLFNQQTLHGYIYMRWQKFYLKTLITKIGPISTLKLRAWLAKHYHAKVLTGKQAKDIVLLNEPIPYQQIEKVVPYPVARDIVLAASPKLTVYNCGCRLARKEHCEPTEVCLWIGDPFADFMKEHHPKEGREISKQEALNILSAEHERGHVHTAWFKDAMIDRFYVICNCCPCCCGGIEVMNKYGIPMLASSGSVAVINQELCELCGTCVEICPFNALALNGGVKLNWEKCMGCGVCVDHCPTNAIELKMDSRKGVPLEVKDLSAFSV